MRLIQRESLADWEKKYKSALHEEEASEEYVS
jgi:hypothetical protein